MAYEILPHTADVGITASAPTLEELFIEAARGMVAIILDADPRAPTDSALITADGDDLESLLVSFLTECLFLHEARGELASGGNVAINGTTARGDLLTSPAEGAAGPQIKAVTYHQLRVERVDDHWEADVFFDV
jgi:protein archease